MLPRPHGTWTGTSGMVGIMSGPRIALLAEEMESLDEVDGVLDTLGCELGTCVVVEHEVDDEDGD